MTEERKSETSRRGSGMFLGFGTFAFDFADFFGFRSFGFLSDFGFRISDFSPSHPSLSAGIGLSNIE